MNLELHVPTSEVCRAHNLPPRDLPTDGRRCEWERKPHQTIYALLPALT